MFESIDIMKLFMNHIAVTIEYNSILNINDKEVEMNTIFIHDGNRFIQVYYEDEEFKVFKIYNEIPITDKEQRVEYITHAIQLIRG